MLSPRQVFVAMPFDKAFDCVYESGIRPAIDNTKDANGRRLRPLRVDQVFDNTSILSDIEKGIRQSVVVVADVTGRNPNVFYEIGFARAAGKEIVLLTQNADQMPFDLKQHRYLPYGTSAGQLDELRDHLGETLLNVLPRAVEQIERQQRAEWLHAQSASSIVLCHGTKHTVPNSGAFWNQFLLRSKRCFYLVGHSNRSWIDKGEEQATILGDAIVQLLLGGGMVRVLSSDDPEIVRKHTDFFREFVITRIACLPEGDQNELKAAMHPSSTSQMMYVVRPSTHYGAVVSDERLVLLPTVNSDEFRDNAMVVELVKNINIPQFDNYWADINRMFRNGCSRIDLSSLWHG